MSDTGDAISTGKYRIGAVSELTGIPPETLRAWERRYGAVEPCRAESGFRLYSEEDVERLLLIKRLSDRGNAIGSIAALKRDELEERLARVESARRVTAGLRSFADARSGPLPVALLDPALEEQMEEADSAADAFRVVASAESPQALLDRMPDAPPAVLVAFLDRLGSDPVATARLLSEADGVVGVVVRYHFAPRTLLRQLALLGARLLRGAVELNALHASVSEAAIMGSAWGPITALHANASNGNAPRRFSDRELGRLREMDSSVGCECPNHLSSIISSLLAFEKYSEECEDVNPQDAELHALLYRRTGDARVIMEQVLELLCQAEGLQP